MENVWLIQYKISTENVFNSVKYWSLVQPFSTVWSTHRHTDHATVVQRTVGHICLHAMRPRSDQVSSTDLLASIYRGEFVHQFLISSSIPTITKDPKSQNWRWLIDWVKVLRPHQIGLPSQSLGLVLKTIKWNDSDHAPSEGNLLSNP